MTINEKLAGAVETLDGLPQKGLSPVEYGSQREKALIEGLRGLAEQFGRKLKGPYMIDANGELDFNLEDPWTQTYGDELAAILSTIPWRCGIRPTTAAMMPSGTWCRLNHFDAERLLRDVTGKATV